MIFYQAFVEVQGAEGNRYWNRLATPSTVRDDAEADVLKYLESKRDGTNGFRKGPPGRTRIDEKRI